MTLTWRIKNFFSIKRMRHSVLRIPYCGLGRADFKKALSGDSPWFQSRLPLSAATTCASAA
jgi:hypothetical protein